MHNAGRQLHRRLHARFGADVEEPVVTHVVDAEVEGRVLLRVLQYRSQVEHYLLGKGRRRERLLSIGGGDEELGEQPPRLGGPLDEQPVVCEDDHEPGTHVEPDPGAARLDIPAAVHTEVVVPLPEGERCPVFIFIAIEGNHEPDESSVLFRRFGVIEVEESDAHYWVE